MVTPIYSLSNLILINFVYTTAVFIIMRLLNRLIKQLAKLKFLLLQTTMTFHYTVIQRRFNLLFNLHNGV